MLSVGSLDQMQAWGEFALDMRFKDHVLMPGFVEGHSHLGEGARWAWPYLGWFDRSDPSGKIWPGLRSMDAIVSRLREVDAAMTKEGKGAEEPLIAWGLEPIYFDNERMTVRHLDRASTHRPIVVTHANGHLMNVNSAMLRLAGIDESTEVEGVIKFPDGTPTGELKEPAAMFLVQRKISKVGFGAPMGEAGLRSFASMASRNGVTTATDLINRLSDRDCALMERVCPSDDFSVRLVPAFQAFHGPKLALDGAKHVYECMRRNVNKLRYGPVKMMLDGSMQGFSARLRWPGYFNGAENGIWVMDPAQFEADFEVYHRAGLVVHVHTNGDEASEVAISAIERVFARAPRPDHRHTLQHGQMLDDALFRRMAALGLCANLFAAHMWHWGDQHYEIMLGPDRALRVDACRSALDAGVELAIHTDAPVTPLMPLFNAWCAVNRMTPSGRVLGEAQRITVPEALRAITLGPAWTLKLDSEIGSIEFGKQADFAVLEDDPLAVDPMKLKDVGVWGSVLSGQPFPANRT